MKVLGIVSEYNPFHNGHKFHLEKSREITGCDAVISVMSGNFVQRGEPAIIDKWTRTKMALLSGVDLVIENPCIYSAGSAEFFAGSAVKLLDSTGVVDCLCFGSESGNLDELSIAADILNNENELFKDLLQKNLKKGLSFPAAREATIREYLSQSGNKQLEDTMKSSNNILGIEYMKAIKRLKSSMQPYTIKRTGNNYNDENITGIFSSANAIRNFIKKSYAGCTVDKKNIYGELEKVMPKDCLDLLTDEFEKGTGPVFPETFGSLILGNLRKLRADEIRELQDVSEGLENRIKHAANIAGDYETLLDMICAKRYTRTRINRVLFYSLTGITKNMYDSFNGPPYIRVLGFNSKGLKLLTRIKKQSTLPVVTRAASIEKSHGNMEKELFRIENIATDLYVLGCPDKNKRQSGLEYRKKIIRLP
ncbi:MAG TPA: nucleotidyltransferase [Clostridiaceae bacterium]|nr:nucleotidyltransferase [Clostridiaceae bacterium]